MIRRLLDNGLGSARARLCDELLNRVLTPYEAGNCAIKCHRHVGALLARQCKFVRKDLAKKRRSYSYQYTYKPNNYAHISSVEHLKPIRGNVTHAISTIVRA